MTIKESLLQTAETLRTVSPSPELDARILLSHVLGYDITSLILNRDQELPSRHSILLHHCVQQRLSSMPVAYIIGKKEFYGMDFLVTPEVLIPRPETECMIDWISRNLPHPPRIIDIGTGTGCIAISLATLYPESHILGCDISEYALSIARKNDTLILGEDSKIQWIVSDLLEEIPPSYTPTLITANLPYLDQNRYTDDSISHEPDIALYSPDNGLEHYIRLLNYLASHLFFVPQVLIIEINPEQMDPIANIVTGLFPQHTLDLIYDYAGMVRHLAIRFS